MPQYEELEEPKGPKGNRFKLVLWAGGGELSRMGRRHAAEPKRGGASPHHKKKGSRKRGLGCLVWSKRKRGLGCLVWGVRGTHP